MILTAAILMTLVVAAAIVWECYQAGVTRMYTLWPAALYLVLSLLSLSSLCLLDSSSLCLLDSSSLRLLDSSSLRLLDSSSLRLLDSSSLRLLDSLSLRLFVFVSPQLAVLALIFLTLRLDRAYLAASTQELSFSATLLLLLGSYISPTLYLYIPILWIALILQQSFSLRSALASLLAIGVFLIWSTLLQSSLSSSSLRLFDSSSLRLFDSSSLSLFDSSSLSLLDSSSLSLLDSSSLRLLDSLSLRLFVFISLTLLSLFFLSSIYWRFGRTSRRRRFMTNLHALYLLPPILSFSFSSLRLFDSSSLRLFDSSSLRPFDSLSLRLFDSLSLRLFDSSSSLLLYSTCILAVLYQRRND